MKFEVQANGLFMGVYEASDAQAAILAYVQDAGYKTIADACKVCGQTEDQFLAEVSAKPV
jgi:hypothetical protein